MIHQCEGRGREQGWGKKSCFLMCLLSFVSGVVCNLLGNTCCPLAWPFSSSPLPSTGFTCCAVLFWSSCWGMALSCGSTCGGRQNSQFLLAFLDNGGALVSWLPVAYAQHVPFTSVAAIVSILLSITAIPVNSWRERSVAFWLLFNCCQWDRLLLGWYRAAHDPTGVKLS